MRANQAQPKTEGVPLLIRDDDQSSLSLSSQEDSDQSSPYDQSVTLKPGKPGAVRVTFDSIELEWTKPEQSAHNVTSYTICYRSTEDPPDQWTKQDAALTVTADDRAHEKVSLTVTQLVENTIYYFKVRPECIIEAGNVVESDISEPIKTKGMIPSRPGKPQCSSVKFNYDSIQLEWTKPEQGAHNIIAYHIFYRSHNDPPDKWMEQKVESAKETVTISQLSERTIYSFKVRPECEDGFGLESDISEPITTKMIIPSKPGKPIATNVSHDSIQLEWTKSEQGVHNITSYSIYYRSAGDPSHQWTERNVYLTMTADNETMLVTQLMEKTTYHFKVRPECTVGNGVESDISEAITTKGVIPSRPGKPQYSSVSHDSIQLEWTKPEQGAHNIIAYHIFYRSHNDPPDKWMEQKVESAKETVTISQLSERTIYSFKVRPECEDGFGLESDISEPITTKMIIPSKPGKPIALSVNHNSVQLKWSKPQQSAHNITSYMIFYRSVTDPPDQWIQLKSGTAEERYIVSLLSENTTYNFKIQPEYESGIGIDSDVSDSIKTKGLPFPIVFEKLWDAREKWKYIGLCLGVDKTDLNVIEKSCQWNVDSCLFGMLSKWLDNVSGTWQMLIDALRNKIVDCYALADSIEAEFLPHAKVPTCGGIIQSGHGFKCPHCGTSLEKHFNRECPLLLSSSESALPFLDTNKLTKDEKLTLHVKLIKETDNIQEQFNNLLDQMAESFEDMENKKLQNVAVFMQNRLSISGPLSAVNSSGAIVQCLREKTSFFNYCNVQCIINKFGTDTDKEMLSAYETDFKKFCKRSVFEVPEAVFGPPPDHGQMLVFKVTDQIIESLPPTCDRGLPVDHHTVIKSANTLRISLSDALKVQMKIAEVLGIKNVGPQNLEFLGASKGCIELKFSTPSDIIDKVKEQYGVKTLTELPGFADLEAANIHILGGPPGKPYAINATSNSIHLQWSKLEYEGSRPIQYYCVHYKSLKDPSAKWKTIQSKAFAKNLEIKCLSQNVKPFIFKVQAINAIGPGIPSKNSDPIDLQPPLVEISGDFPSKPGKPHALSITHDSIQLEWTKPERGVESITSYTILYRAQFNDPPNQWIEKRSVSAEERVIVSQLLENTTYLFQVQPECEAGVGLESDISDPIKTKIIIPSKPGKPKCIDATNNSIQLEWTKPEEGAHNTTSYTIFYHSASDPPDTWSGHKAVTNEEVLLPQLSENMVYYFKIRPECETGVGLESDISDPIQTKMIIPSKPGKPTASSVTHNSIQLQWTKPEQGAHNVTSYVIFYRSTSDPLDQWIQLRTKTAEERFTVSHLSENSIYSFKIQPEFEGGVGTESDVSEPVKTGGLPLSIVVQKLWDAREKWYCIGLCLGLDKTDLDIIETNYQQNSCLLRMLSLWLNQVNGTWQMLIDALHDKTVGYHSLADSIEAEFLSHTNIPTRGRIVQSGNKFECPLCGNCSLEKYLKRECPNFQSASDSAFPFLDTSKLTKDEKLELHEKLVKETNSINNEFNDLIYQMSESFEEMSNKELQKVANFLNIQLSITPPLEVCYASAIIQYLSKNTSFFDYKNLGLVINRFGTDKDKEKLRAYELSFQNFCKRSVFEVPNFGSPPDHGQMLVFKVTNQVIEGLSHNWHALPDSEFYRSTIKQSAKTLQVSLNDALKIQRKITRVLGIENGCLLFLGTSERSIELKFSVPNAILDKAKEQHGVKTLTELPGFAELEAANIHILCGPPGKPCAINATSHSINLQWSKPEYEGPHPMQHYCVHYKSFKDPLAKWKTLQSKAYNENFEIGRLSQSESPFVFKVQAVNAIGPGISSTNSDPIDLMRPPFDKVYGDFPSKPGKPHALSITHDSIQLEWTKPERGVESITSYTILYRAQFNDPPNQWIEKRSVSAEERVIVSQLLENTTYLFLVQPECEAGVGLESDVSDPIETKMIIPSKPGKPRALNVTDNSIKLEWTKPEQDAHNVTSYSVLCCSTSDPADYWTEYKAIATEESVLISQLRENTVYYFKVQPHYADGFGLQSDVSDPISTKMIIPSQPGKPKCVLVTHDSIQIEWTKPEQGAHNVTTYTIFYCSTSDPPDIWTQQKVKATEENLTVSELSQNAIYFFKVRPECGDSFGSESDISEPIKTKKKIPSTRGTTGASIVS